MPDPVIVWFRQDLRLADNPALTAAVSQGGPVVPVYVFAPEEEGDWPPGGASLWWLHHSLTSLSHDLKQKLGLELVVRRSTDSLRELRNLCQQTQARTVVWNRRYEPAIIERDRQLKESLRDAGLSAHSFNGSLLHEPWELSTRQGDPYKVYTPFWKAGLAKKTEHEVLPIPSRAKRLANPVDSLAVEELELLPRIDWAGGLREMWTPGEAAAAEHLQHFVKQTLGDYAEGRNRPDWSGTSRLSPYLHFGEISPRQVLLAVEQARQSMRGPRRESAEVYLKEIFWREFAYHVLYHFPETALKPLQNRFGRFPWLRSQQHLQAWQAGQTGYPLVDAGMRELWHTGWMHNRVRMVVASLLTKHLLIRWQAGAKWFWDTLVDADLANNSLGWQWTAGCGADAAPYFRIFNPTRQAEKFDPAGDYIRRWVPELKSLLTPQLFEPWSLDAKAINYPEPIVEHAEARERALAAFATIK